MKNFRSLPPAAKVPPQPSIYIPRPASCPNNLPILRSQLPAPRSLRSHRSPRPGARTLPTCQTLSEQSTAKPWQSPRRTLNGWKAPLARQCGLSGRLFGAKVRRPLPGPGPGCPIRQRRGSQARDHVLRAACAHWRIAGCLQWHQGAGPAGDWQSFSPPCKPHGNLCEDWASAGCGWSVAAGGSPSGRSVCS